MNPRGKAFNPLNSSFAELLQQHEPSLQTPQLYFLSFTIMLRFGNVFHLRGVGDDRKRQADSPEIRKDTFVIQSDRWISDYVAVNLGVGHEAERVRDVGEVFLRTRQTLNRRGLCEATCGFAQPYLQRPSSAGFIVFFRYPGSVIRHVVDGGFQSATGGVGQVQTVQRHIVIHEEILLGSDSDDVTAAQNFDVCI